MAASGTADDAFLQELRDRYVVRPLGTEDVEGVALDPPRYPEEELMLWWEWMTHLRPCGAATVNEMRLQLTKYQDSIPMGAGLCRAYDAMEGKVEIADKRHPVMGFYFMFGDRLVSMAYDHDPTRASTWVVVAGDQIWLFSSIEKLSAWVDHIRDPMVKSAKKS